MAKMIYTVGYEISIDEWYIDGVFSNKKLAIKRAEELVADKSLSRQCDSVFVERWEINKSGAVDTVWHWRRPQKPMKGLQKVWYTAEFPEPPKEIDCGS